MPIKKQVYVTTNPSGAAALKYGYSTSSATYTQANADLGVAEADGVAGVIFGCNSPKPARLIKRTAARTFSSFASDTKIKAAQQSGDWKIVSPIKVRGAGGRLRKATFVPLTIGSIGVNYGFYCDQDTFAQASVYGAERMTSDADVKKAIWGVNSHKPARAYGKPNTANNPTSPGFSFYITTAKIPDAQAAGYSVDLPYIKT